MVNMVKGVIFDILGGAKIQKNVNLRSLFQRIEVR